MIKNAIITFKESVELTGFVLKEDKDIVLKTIPFEQITAKIIVHNDSYTDFVSDDCLFMTVPSNLLSIQYI